MTNFVMAFTWEICQSWSNSE